ncbi:small, acid-soluble spore protein, H family [Paraclostridium sordellii]|uniref:small, acid-soluble spore protein, H family n=1 Tax=Paraclostridium sordellii TaxID=1505 RepID=UPI0005DB5763|nr:small, acid-soluble spore protein, H family [Paeniclostridium sordellii]MCQ4696894.1 small, acid-soluble spore protein, H family [Paeniclostridium sordellii]CEN83494.1 acid-soluble spore protein H [[Clostridium] sordellii] [Paeniclostridium sordellii]CEO10812.1 acid-soluble spore protein H [[Clostridium] sordellii] [Paeniclostridium sordellii]CEO24519.1 acid-soluble spore protein H [[Clostridium] sordellii] [Paeniclostridium sordellii]CEQ10262.1 acid-soluble spore protein H [[Clostridium] s
MQLRRAMEICNNKNLENVELVYNDNPVKLISVDNNIGTAYIESINDNSKFEVDLESLHEKTHI